VGCSGFRWKCWSGTGTTTCCRALRTFPASSIESAAVRAVYSGQVRVWRKLGLVGGTALLFCLPALLRPACSHPAVAAHGIPLTDTGGQLYKVHIDKCGQAAGNREAAAFPPVSEKELRAIRPERIWSNGTRIDLGEWEVAVVFDSVHCDVYCAYRRKANGSGRVMPALLLPPPVSVQIPRGAASVPVSVVIDPSGLTLPSLGSRWHAAQAPLYLPAKRFFRIALAPQGSRTAGSASAALGSLAGQDFLGLASSLLPLRI
jgi:hypothetical protein